MRHFAYPLCARSAVKVLHGLPLQTFAMERGVHAALRTLQAAPTPARWWCAGPGTDPASIKRVYAPKANGARLLSALPPASTQQHACATSALSSRDARASCFLRIRVTHTTNFFNKQGRTCPPRTQESHAVTPRAP